MRKAVTLRPRLMLTVAAGAVAGCLLAVAGWQGSASSAAAALSPLKVYEGLRADALRGDERAAEYIAALDKYLLAHGLAPSDLAAPVTRSQVEDHGIESFRLQGSAPWRLLVKNDTIVEDRSGFEAYRGLRHGVLEVMADSSPQRQIEVVVTPSALTTIPELAAALDCRCAVVAVNADVFVGDAWIMSVGGGFDGSDLASDAAEIQSTLLNAASSNLDLYPSVDKADIRLTARSLRLRLTASEARSVSKKGTVLLVDPTTDIHDRFATRAAVVEVHNTPDVFTWYAEKELGVSLLPLELEPVRDADPGETDAEREAEEQKLMLMEGGEQ